MTWLLSRENCSKKAKTIKIARVFEREESLFINSKQWDEKDGKARDA